MVIIDQGETISDSNQYIMTVLNIAQVQHDVPNLIDMQ